MKYCLNCGFNIEKYTQKEPEIKVPKEVKSEELPYRAQLEQKVKEAPLQGPIQDLGSDDEVITQIAKKKLVKRAPTTKQLVALEKARQSKLAKKKVRDTAPPQQVQQEATLYEPEPQEYQEVCYINPKYL